MRIYFNGRFLTQHITGVQRYAIEIIKAWDQICLETENENQYVLLVPKNTRYTFHFHVIEVRQVGHLQGYLWEQFELPFYTRDGFLINLCNCAPIIKRDQTVTMHDAAVFACPGGFSLLFRLWYRLMFLCLGHRLNLFFTVSNFSKRELNSYLGIPLKYIHVTYNGVDHIRELRNDGREELLNKNKYVLSVCSMNPNKNFSLVLKIAKEIPDVSFFIAGGSNNKVFQKWMINNVPSNVKFLGYVADEELVTLYAHATCFLFPSLYEGFGIPPLEAMTFGCPVIASNCAALPEICGDAAIYCPPDLPTAWVEAIRSIMDENNDIRDDLVKKSRVVVSQYCWRASAKKMMELISARSQR